MARPTGFEPVKSITLPIVATPNSAAHFRHYFRRDDLYHLVWTSPVTEIAARLGVSDVALAKLCRRAAIPIPGRGYWQRTEAGQPVEPTPLGVAPKGLTELLRIRGTRSATSSRSRASTTGARAAAVRLAVTRAVRRSPFCALRAPRSTLLARHRRSSLQCRVQR